MEYNPYKEHQYINMPVIIKYYTDEYTKHSESFATADAVANISSLLAKEGFEYNKDVSLAEVYYAEGSGRQIIAFEFQDERRAMLIKLQGIKNG